MSVWSVLKILIFSVPFRHLHLQSQKV